MSDNTLEIMGSNGAVVVFRKLHTGETGIDIKASPTESLVLATTTVKGFEREEIANHLDNPYVPCIPDSAQVISGVSVNVWDSVCPIYLVRSSYDDEIWIDGSGEEHYSDELSLSFDNIKVEVSE